MARKPIIRTEINIFTGFEVLLQPQLSGCLAVWLWLTSCLVEADLSPPNWAMCCCARDRPVIVSDLLRDVDFIRKPHFAQRRYFIINCGNGGHPGSYKPGSLVLQKAAGEASHFPICLSGVSPQRL